MKTKIFTSLILGMLIVVFLAGFASATITFSNIPTLTQDGDSATISITGAIGENITFSLTSITEDGKTITFSTPAEITGATGNAQTVILNYTVTDFDFKFEKVYSTTLTATGTTSGDHTQTLSFEQTSFYDGDNNGHLEVSDINIDDNDFGNDEEYWYPLDNVKVKFNVANDGDWKINDIEIKACLWDENKGKCIMDEDDMDLSDDKFDLKSDKDVDITMEFQVDPEDLTAGNTDYILYIKAVGEIHDSDYDGDETGDSDSQEIEIRTDEKFVIIDEIEVNPETAQCGSQIEITADIWNIGDEDLDDDEVFIRVLNTELGIDKKVTFTNGIDSMDKESLDLTFQIPKNVEEKPYTIKMTVYDDEDMDDSDIYENDEEDQAEYRAYITVEGNCAVSGGAQAIISATLESGGKAGQEMVIKATITNTGSDDTTFNVNIAGYSEWASSASADKTAFTLDKGESEVLSITFDVKSGVSGSESFNIELLSDNQLVATQPVTVQIQSSGFDLISSLQNNTLLWVIGALNAILVVAIIVVIIRIIAKS